MLDLSPPVVRRQLGLELAVDQYTWKFTGPRPPAVEKFSRELAEIAGESRALSRKDKCDSKIILERCREIVHRYGAAVWPRNDSRPWLGLQQAELFWDTDSDKILDLVYAMAIRTIIKNRKSQTPSEGKDPPTKPPPRPVYAMAIKTMITNRKTQTPPEGKDPPPRPHPRCYASEPTQLSHLDASHLQKEGIWLGDYFAHHRIVNGLSYDDLKKSYYEPMRERCAPRVERALQIQGRHLSTNKVMECASCQKEHPELAFELDRESLLFEHELRTELKEKKKVWIFPCRLQDRHVFAILGHPQGFKISDHSQLGFWKVQGGYTKTIRVVISIKQVSIASKVRRMNNGRFEQMSQNDDAKSKELISAVPFSAEPPPTYWDVHQHREKPRGSFRDENLPRTRQLEYEPVRLHTFHTAASATMDQRMRRPESQARKCVRFSPDPPECPAVRAATSANSQLQPMEVPSSSLRRISVASLCNDPSAMDVDKASFSGKSETKVREAQLTSSGGIQGIDQRLHIRNQSIWSGKSRCSQESLDGYGYHPTSSDGMQEWPEVHGSDASKALSDGVCLELNDQPEGFFSHRLPCSSPHKSSSIDRMQLAQDPQVTQCATLFIHWDALPGFPDVKTLHSDHSHKVLFKELRDLRPKDELREIESAHVTLINGEETCITKSLNCRILKEGGEDAFQFILRGVRAARTPLTLPELRVKIVLA